MVEVINLKTCKDWGKEGDVYIGRKFGKYPASKWGNPFKGDRDTVCDQYEVWVQGEIDAGRLDIKELLPAKRLGCWCKMPNKEVRCHGDSLIKRIIAHNWYPTDLYRQREHP